MEAVPGGENPVPEGPGIPSAACRDSTGVYITEPVREPVVVLGYNEKHR